MKRGSGRRSKNDVPINASGWSSRKLTIDSNAGERQQPKARRAGEGPRASSGALSELARSPALARPPHTRSTTASTATSPSVGHGHAAGHRRADAEAQRREAANAAVLRDPHRPVDRQQRKERRGRVDREEVRELDRQRRQRQEQRRQQPDPPAIQSPADQEHHDDAQQLKQRRPRAADAMDKIVAGEIIAGSGSAALAAARYAARAGRGSAPAARCPNSLRRSGAHRRSAARSWGVSTTAVRCVSVCGSSPYT